MNIEFGGKIYIWGEDGYNCSIFNNENFKGFSQTHTVFMPSKHVSEIPAFREVYIKHLRTEKLLRYRNGKRNKV